MSLLDTICFDMEQKGQSDLPYGDNCERLTSTDSQRPQVMREALFNVN